MSICNQDSVLSHGVLDLMSDIFSTPASHAFDHPEVGSSTESAEAGPSSMGDAVRDLSIEEAFEVEDTVRLVLEGGFKTVSLW